MGSGRRHDFDWLRVIAIYMLFPIHAAIVFSPLPFYHIRNGTTTRKVLIFLAFVEPWIMPLFFVLAGWGFYHSLRRRGSRGYLKRRVQHLLIPLLVGCALLGPPIKFMELRSGFEAHYMSQCADSEFQQGFGPCIPQGPPRTPEFDEGFLAFWPTFFSDFYRFTWSHLWFLGYLFTFSVVGLPLLRWLAVRRWKSPGRTAWIYLPMLPLLVIELVLRPHWPGFPNLHNDWANIAYFSICLLAGFLLAKYPGLEGTLQREWRRGLALFLGGVLTRILLGVAEYLGLAIAPPMVWSAALVIASWGGTVALLGFARQHLNDTRPLLDYLRASAYPVYFLHEAAVVCIGYAVVKLPLAGPVKFLLLLVSSFTVTLTVYHYVVRPALGAMLRTSDREWLVAHPGRAGTRGPDLRSGQPALDKEGDRV
jgi:hypothetical protein